MILELLAADPPAAAAPDYTPAMIGLGGVIIGGALTGLSQAILRRADKLHKMREEVAALISSSMNTRTSMKMVHHTTPLPTEERAQYADSLNQETTKLYLLHHVLTLTAPRSIGSASKQLAQAVESATHYGEPRNGTGNADSFERMPAHLKYIGFCEDSLILVAKSAFFMRWPHYWRSLHDAKKRLKPEAPNQ